MTLNEIKAAVESGNRVCWRNTCYVVVKDKLGQWLIMYQPNDHCIGLTWRDNVTMNGREDEFFIDDYKP